MNPEHSATPQDGPTPRGGLKGIRRLVAIAAAVTVAVGTPAVAVAAAATSQSGTGTTYAADPHCDDDYDDEDDEYPNRKCKTPKARPTVTVTRTVTAYPTATATVTATATTTACGTGVDSAKSNGNEQFLAALVNGVPYAGRRAATNTAPDSPNIVSGPSNAPGWTNLSAITGYPTDSPVCDISVDSQGSDVFYKIITTAGTVHTLHCASNGSTVICPAPAQGQTPQSQWVAVTPQPAP
ncbi:hypothetical protein ACFWA6_02755 [Streptomyces sp. NPDC060020]|uniref:hypothetical protein n=1 Tax=Streptomyces sp. NPDC060020 TaxID=3347038 RepID=UPI0036B452BB